jgi:hypothetical protein
MMIMGFAGVDFTTYRRRKVAATAAKSLSETAFGRSF